jgi:hypothetical protein
VREKKEVMVGLLRVAMEVVRARTSKRGEEGARGGGEVVKGQSQVMAMVGGNRVAGGNNVTI